MKYHVFYSILSIFIINNHFAYSKNDIWSQISQNYDMSDMINMFQNNDMFDMLNIFQNLDLSLNDVTSMLSDQLKNYGFAKFIRDNVEIDQESLKEFKKQWQPYMEKAKEIDFEETWKNLQDFNYMEIFDEHSVEKYGEKSYYFLRSVVYNILQNRAATFSNLFSSPCKNHMFEYLMLFVNWNFTTGPNNAYDEWGVRLLDSSAILGTGELTKRNIHIFGEIGECLEAKYHDGDMVGQYCTIRFTPKQKSKEKLFDQSPTKGYCFPSTCLESELSRVFRKHFSTNTTRVSIPKGACMTSKSLMNLQTSSAEFYLWILVIMIGVSTCIHWWSLSRGQTKNKTSMSSVIECFSVVDSWEKLLSLSDGLEDLAIFHGLHCLSFVHIALVIEFLSFLIRPAYNLYYLKQFMNSWSNLMFMQSLPLDTMLFCTSCKLAYQYGTNLSFIKLAFKLYLRCLAAVAFTLLVLSPFIPVWGVGQWSFYSNAVGYENCQSLFWKKILFIDNFSRESHKCLPHLTYLSVAMQLLLTTPFLLYLSVKNRKSFSFAVILLTGVCVTTVFIKTKYNELPPSLFAGGLVDFYETIQVSATTRAVPWLSGLWIGTKLATDKTSKIKIILNKYLVLLSWIGVTVLAISALISVRIFNYEFNAKYDATVSASYAAFHALPWVAALSLLTYLTAHGYGGTISSILGCDYFQVLGKLTRNGLIVYYVWRLLRNGYQRDSPFLGYFYMWDDFLGNTVISILGSGIIYLLIDGPLIKLTDLMFAEKEKKSTRKLNKKKIH